VVTVHGAEAQLSIDSNSKLKPVMRVVLLKTWRDLSAAGTQTMTLVFIMALGITSFLTLVGGYRDLGTSYQHT
jgi:hypothetical protein